MNIYYMFIYLFQTFYNYYERLFKLKKKSFIKKKKKRKNSYYKYI